MIGGGNIFRGMAGYGFTRMDRATADYMGMPGPLVMDAMAFVRTRCARPV